MASRGGKGLRMDSDYKEEVVGFALESFLTVISFPSYRFTIEPFSRGRERFIGADARLISRIAGFKPFYMQFKRPTAYPNSSASKIIADREKLGLRVSPMALYFGLREKQPKHHDYQHNILYRLRRRLIARGIGDAAYVCPLFLQRATYRSKLHVAGLSAWINPFRSDPWRYENLLIHHASSTTNFANMPILKMHVSIPPHDRVNSAKHSYSFTARGKDLCFHSPEKISDGGSTLAVFLDGLVGDITSSAGFMHPEESKQELIGLMGVSGQDEILSNSSVFDRNGLDSWLNWGDFLRTEYGIDQFALMRWKS